MPFPPKKKPEDETLKPKASPAPAEKPTDAPAPKPAPGEKPAFGAKPAAEKPVVEEAAKPGTAPPAAPAKSGTAKPSAPASPSKGGSSAPMTPGQGEPDVKPHEEPGAKAEPEGDKQKLPKEADTAPAKERPKGLPSVAMMTKAEAESKDKDPMNNPHIQRLATLVQGLAKIVEEHHARLGAMPLPGQAMSSPYSVGQQKQTMPGSKPGMLGAPTTAKPTMPGMKPGGPMRPGQPGTAGQGVRPGVTAPMPTGATLTLEQIKSMTGIMEAAHAGRLPRQAASMLLATGFGIDPKTAQSMVTADAPQPLSGDPIAPVPGALEGGLEEEPEVDPETGEPIEPEPELGPDGKPVAPAEGETPKKPKPFGAKWDFKPKMDSAESEINTVLARLEARRAEVVSRLDALTLARDTYFEDLFDGLDD